MWHYISETLSKTTLTLLVLTVWGEMRLGQTEEAETGAVSIACCPLSWRTWCYFSSPDVLPSIRLRTYAFVLKVYKELQAQWSAVSNSTLKCSSPHVACLSLLLAPPWEDIIGSNFTFWQCKELVQVVATSDLCKEPCALVTFSPLEICIYVYTHVYTYTHTHSTYTEERKSAIKRHMPFYPHNPSK